MRLGIDLDGVVADFNDGWIRRYNAQHGTRISLDDVVAWDGLVDATHFRSMGEFWHWARDLPDGSLFRHLETYPGSVPALERLADLGHHIVILTTKPTWAVHDTFAWIAEHQIPTREVHMLEDKWVVPCDVYLDDAPHILHGCLAHRPESTVCRYSRPWNDPIPGVVDIADWDEFEALVHRLDGSLR